MSEARLSERNVAIAEMLSDGKSLKNFYRFTAQNPHINLHDACQIVLVRPDALVCFAFEEWNAMERRVTKGRKGIPYYDSDGNKKFVFDVSDTHGDRRYERLILPMKRLLEGLDALNRSNLAESTIGDYRKIHTGVGEYLKENGNLSGDFARNRLLIEGVTHSLYCKTGFPIGRGIELTGLPYSLTENAELFKEIHALSEGLAEEAAEAYVRKQMEIIVVNDTEEEAVTDEPVLPLSEKQAVAEKQKNIIEINSAVQSHYRGYVALVRYNDPTIPNGGEKIYLGKSKNYDNSGHYDNTDNSLVFVSERPKMFYFLHGDGWTLSQDEMLEGGYFSLDDYKEYASLKAGILKGFEQIGEPKFGINLEIQGSGFPFIAPVEQTESVSEERIENAVQTASTSSPRYARYLDAQTEYPNAIVLMRLGDFYEVIGENAGIIANELDLTLTSRDVGLEERVPMCGFPYHVKERYLEKILEQHSVLVVEDGVQSKYILSHAETAEQTDAPQGVQHETVTEQEASVDEYKEWDAGIDEINDFWDYDFDMEDVDEEKEKKEVRPQGKPKGRPISKRKRKEKPQPSLFDILEDKIEDESTTEEQLIEWGLKNGSNVENGKYRIYDKYKTDPTVKEFADFLKQEYGWSGGYSNGQEFQSDGKGLAFAWKDVEHPNRNVAVKLNWVEAANGIADLIDDGNYFTEKENEEYSRILRFRSERNSANSDKERCDIIARQIVEYGTAKTYSEKYREYPHFLEDYTSFLKAHRQEINERLRGYDEVISVGTPKYQDDCYVDVCFKPEYCPQWQARLERLRMESERIQNYANGFIKDCAENYGTENISGDSVVWEIKREEFDEREFLFLKDNRDELIEYLQSTSGVESADFSMERIEIILRREYVDALKKGAIVTPLEERKIKSIVDEIVKEGTENTSDNNWICFFEEFDDEQFVRERVNAIAEELGSRKEVCEVEITEEGFDTIFWTDYCSVHADDEEIPKEDNTDLTEVGFNQAELGGSKQRYRNNIEAIRLTNRLYDEDRSPTLDEKKTLARYVGWGGLAQVFDEHNAQWTKEYAELKTALSSADYERAKGSVLNAHYTSKEVIEGIYKALARFGVKGNNRILEPAMGTGNFFGYMPKEISDGASLYGVELDNVTGKIAAKLYPQVEVQVKGFEETTFPNNHFDIVVSNVPFGGYGVADSDYNRHKFLIHDYFIAKSIDKVRANGIVTVITSKGTLDKLNPSVRKYLADRAELLGAIRLPNTAFKQTANTEVVTDILFFRKRGEQINADTQNTDWIATGKTDEGYEINNYFIRHPEMILGNLVEEHGLYGAIDITVKPNGRELSVALGEAIRNLPENFYENPTEQHVDRAQTPVDYDVRPFNYKAENGRLYLRIGERMVEQELPKSPKDAYERIKGMIALRSQLRHILDIQTEGCSDELLKSEQRILNTNYDSFVRRYGYLSSQTNARLFREDGDSALLFACEELSEDKKTATKADVFSKRTIRPYVSVTNTDDCFEALQISKNERGRVDISYIEELTKKDYDAVLSELGDAVFRNPLEVEPENKYSGFETAEEYLSGKVVQKLGTANNFAMQHPDCGYERNVKALEKVQPKPLTAADITVRLGASWVDKEYYKDFLMSMLGIPFYYRDGLELYYNPHDSSWRVDKTNYVRNSAGMRAKEVYGTERANAFRLYEDCLNLKATNIYDTIEEDGREKRVINQSETIAAREKQNKIKESFKEWIFADPKRREELEATYNRLFNQIRLPSYDGSYLKFPEMNPAIELRPHQKNAVHRIITGGNTLLHHVVGAGKTYTIAAAIMKLRQYGLAKKPMIAVPNHLVEQWAGEFRTLYPNAKLLIATKEDLSKENRQRFVGKVAMGDWDAVIIAQSSFAKIPISTESQIEKIREEITKIDATIEKQWAESGLPRGAVKNLERIKKNKETQLKRLLDDNKKDSLLNFESLGVDYLFVDEAHFYKNKFLFTKMNNVAGVSTTASQRAADLELKVEYINNLHGGDKGVVFATGTPISNSMTEMYTMQSYLSKRTLEEAGLNYFDGWAADFGETVTSLELAPSGQGYKPRTRFAKFTNLPELQTMYRMFADVQTADMVKLDVPEAERRVINLKPSETVIELAEQIAERAEKINAGGVDPHIDNMLKVTSDGKKLALDARCFDPMVGDEPNSKLNVCAERIFEIWEDTAEKKSAQIVFCDLSTPKRAFGEYEYGRDFDVYNDLKHKLVECGIPEQEIAFIHDANTDQQKQDLFKKVNAGQIRVLIGSTDKCGAGTNAQQRLIALHHLDTPYRPSDMEQREGRIIRQGNTNDKVQIFTYVTERTFDSYSYQILENKQRFISQICKGDMTAREADDIDETTLSYAEIKAITAANPRIKRKMEVDGEIAKLRVLEGQYRKSVYSLQDKVNKVLPEQIRKQTLFIERLNEDAKRLKERYNPDVFSISVNGVVYTDRKDGARALTDALYASKPETVVAEYDGFQISMNPLVLLTTERSVTIAGSGRYVMDIGQSASGNLTRIDNFFADFSNKETRALQKLEQLKKDLDTARSQLEVPFEHRERLTELLKEQSELNAELDLNRREEIVIDDECESGEDNYMSLPERRSELSKMRKTGRKSLDKYSMSVYDKQKSETPEAYIFVKNGSKYELFGEQAERYSEEQGLPVITDILSGERTLVLSLDSNELDKAVGKLVGNGQTVKIIETLENKKEDGIIDNIDRVAEIEVSLLPDYTLTQENMHDYGYKWDGMLPIGSRTAKRLYNLGVEVYRLYKDDTQSGLDDEDGLIAHEGMFGVEKPDWIAFLETDKAKEYLAAKMFVSNAAGKVINDELDYVDSKYADLISDINFAEREALTEFMRNKEIPNTDRMKPYLENLLRDYSDFINNMPLEHYGWSGSDVPHAIAKRIIPEELQEYAKQILQNEESGSAADMANNVDYKRFVDDSVEKEFTRFREEQLKISADELFENNYEIHVKTELREVIKDGDYLDEPQYRALYEENGHILQSLYDDFISNEIASVDDYGKTAEFIRDYNEHYHGDILRAEEQKVLNAQTVYYGRDTENTGYYLFKEKLSLDTLSAIKEKADDYVIAAPVCYLSEEQKSKKHITYLKVGRDVTEEQLSGNDVVSEMQIAVNQVNKAQHDEYRQDLRFNTECKNDIERIVSVNFDGMHLKSGVERELIDKYGLERIEYVLANTLQFKNDDGRFSKENKTWANSIEITQNEGHRYQFAVETHPAVLDGFVNIIRKQRELKKEEQPLEENKYQSETHHGYKIQQMTKDNLGRNVVIAKRPNDYAVGVGYDVKDGRWAQGYYDFATLEAAEQFREENYGTVKTPAEKPQRKWLKVNVAKEAIIERYANHTFFMMPTTGEYAGYTYNVFNNRIKESSQITDLQSDSRELCHQLVLAEGDTVLISNGNGYEKELTVKEFAEAVSGMTAKDYAPIPRITVSLPREAMRKMYEHSTLFVLPNTVKRESYSYFIPNSFAKEDTDSEDGRIILSLPEDFTVKAQDREGVDRIEFTAQEFKKKCDGTTSEQYVFERKEFASGAADGEKRGWQYVSADKAAKIASYENRTLMKMPQGEYGGYTYYLPNKLLKEIVEKGTIRVGLPEDFVINLQDRASGRETNLTVEEYIAEVRDKAAEDYTQYRKPSEVERQRFAETEKRLRQSVPEEMKARSNWVGVRTQQSEDRLRKYLIDCHTGKFAESDNPETWTDFDSACKFAKENGCETIAYALDGKDGVCCIDLDHCIDENGNMTPLANVVKGYRNSYSERSVSGKGLHYFGKTKGLDVRTFSKDGDLEFYQKSHFIAMTGDMLGGSKLIDIDGTRIQELVEVKCEKRTAWKGSGAGVKGLSSMSDRDVVEKACAAKHGETFKALYDGQDVQNNHSNSDMSLMNRLAFWCNGDKEQMLRIFATSGLYRPNKSDAYYEGTAIKAVQDTTSRFQPQATAAPKPAAGNHAEGSGKR